MHHPPHEQKPPPTQMPPPPPQQQQMLLQQQQQQNYSNDQPEVHLIRLAKSTGGGMGLSIVAAKGVGKDRLGIYVKAVVEGGAAHHDGRLAAGDQLLSVDGESLTGITQERAAEIMMRTGQIVELEVAKQGAIYHGLATLLSQPSPVMGRHPQPQQQQPGNGMLPQQQHQQQHPPPLPPDQRLMQHSRSVNSIFPDDQDQHTYQNHHHAVNNPAFRPGMPPMMSPQPPQQQLPQQMVRPNYGRSASVQNLGPNGGRLPVPSALPHQPGSHGRPPSAVMDSDPSAGFYQNVQHPAMQQHRFPSPAMNSNNDTTSELFHATPRIIGTPNASNNFDGNLSALSSGPEKPQRQYAYNNGGEPMLTRPSQSSSGSSQQPATNSNRVRFQEPEQHEEPKSIVSALFPFFCMRVVHSVSASRSLISPLPLDGSRGKLVTHVLVHIYPLDVVESTPKIYSSFLPGVPCTTRFLFHVSHVFFSFFLSFTPCLVQMGKSKVNNTELERLRLSSVEREFRRRVAEYKREDGGGDSASVSCRFTPSACVSRDNYLLTPFLTKCVSQFRTLRSKSRLTRG